MQKTIRDYGFVAPKTIAPEEYVLGGQKVPLVVLNKEADWRPFAPVYEPQFNTHTDPNGCTVWGTESALEMMLKKLTGVEYNFSERFTYILAQIRPPGADPHKVAEVIRKTGLIENSLLPFTEEMSFDEFIQPDPMPERLLRVGRDWLSDNLFLHEWIPTDKKTLAEMLQFSPLGISVTAWYEKDGMYIDNGQPNTHWCVLMYMDKVQGKYYPVIFDSYTHSEKILDSEHNIQFAKRFYIETGLGKSRRQVTSFWERVKKWVCKR
jgi:hypothetical protein